MSTDIHTMKEELVEQNSEPPAVIGDVLGDRNGSAKCSLNGSIRSMKEELEDSKNSELPAVIGALLDMLDDRNESVKRSINESIRRIADKSPEVVIHTVVYFWEMHAKISVEHMTSVLKLTSDTFNNAVETMNEDLVSSVVEFAVMQLTGEAAAAAEELLTSLSKQYCTQAMGGLLIKLEPGILPHSNVVRIVGVIAAANPKGMLCFFKIALTIMLPMLTQTRDETLKQSFCFTIGKISEAIYDYIMNIEEGCKPEITKDTYKEEISTGFDIFTHNWLKHSRDNKLADSVLTALVPMVPLVPQEMENERIIKLIPTLMSFCKRAGTRLAAVRVLAVVLNCATKNDKEGLRPFLEQIHQIISELVSVSPFEVSHDVLLTHYEVLRCSRSLVMLYPEEGLDRILQQLKSPLAGTRARALVVLRHLINTLPAEDDATLQRIALNLQDSLGDSGARQMVGALVALAARPSLPLLPSQRAIFVRYMVSHCGTKNEETDAYSEALHLLATTVDGAETWLWPCLIRSLLDPAYAISAVPVLNALSPLAAKMIRVDSSDITKDFPGTKVLGRCLELMGEPANRLAVVTFLKAAAPLLGHQLKPYWDEKLVELAQFIHDEQNCDISLHEQRIVTWEDRVVEFLEESVKLEGDMWGSKLADELAMKASSPNVAAYLASICNNNAHITLLVELTRSHSTNEEYARAVGICSKRHLGIVLKLMEDFCSTEDSRKVPVRLLGLVRDTKAAATAEAAKAGLLRAYGEIALRADIEQLHKSLEKHAAPWIIRQLNDCKELTTKEAGLIALEQVTNAVHPDRLLNSGGLRVKPSALAILLGTLQTSAGYKPLQLYPRILKAAVALIRIPPVLTPEEREVFLSSVLDKVIVASTEIAQLLQPEIMMQVIDELGTVCSEIVLDSADALAELVDILLPWMQSKSATERKTALQVLRTTLMSYYNSIKYTFPGGKLEPGKLIGRILSWLADPAPELRPLIIDCVGLSLNIAMRHRSLPMDSEFEVELKISKINANYSPKVLYDGIKNLASSVSTRIPSGEIINLAEGLIEGLLFRGEAGLAAGIALTQHFEIKGPEISRTDVYLVDNIIAQMRHMENAACRKSTADAVCALMIHHPEEVIQHLLAQPLPLDRGSEQCWNTLGSMEELGLSTLQMLLTRLENNNLLSETNALSHPGKNNTACFASLAAVVALRHLLQAPNSEVLIEKELAGLLSVLLKYLAGWLHVDAPASVINTKFGYVPNREASKINPHAEVYSVLTNVLTTVDSSVASGLLNETTFGQESQAEKSIVSTVRTMMRCISNKHEVLASMAQSLGKLMTSGIAMQRAVAATFYAELIGKVNCGTIWLDAIVNTLHEAKADSSPLVRKLATIGLARIAYLEPKQIDEYFENCMEALLNGLEESATGDGGNEVILESLRGLSVLLAARFQRPISPRVVMALKPFIEKENWEMRLAAISALGAVASGWQKSITSPDDDITDHLLGCLPCLIIRLEDSNTIVAKTAQETLCKTASLLQSGSLSLVLSTYLSQHAEFHLEGFLEALIGCLQEELPQRADELRNAVVRGYSKSENTSTRATAALILGLFGAPRPEDIQRLLQLLRDQEGLVRIRAARALALCFTK